MLNVGILGCGRIGQVHAASLDLMTDARVAAVADFLPEAAQALAAKSGAPVMEGDALINNPDIDAVVIGTPTDTHYELIQKAAKAGRYVGPTYQRMSNCGRTGRRDLFDRVQPAL